MKKHNHLTHPAPYVIALMVWGAAIATGLVVWLVEYVIGRELPGPSYVSIIIPPLVVGQYLATKRRKVMTRSLRWSATAWYTGSAFLVAVGIIVLETVFRYQWIGIPRGNLPLFLLVLVFISLFIAPITYFELWFGEYLALRALRKKGLLEETAPPAPTQQTDLVAAANAAVLKKDYAEAVRLYNLAEGLGPLGDQEQRFRQLAARRIRES